MLIYVLRRASVIIIKGDYDMSEKSIWLLGLIACSVVLAVIIITNVIKKHKNSKDEYDERQILARNIAYKCAFFTLLFYNLVCAVLSAAEIKWADTTAQIFIGICLSTFVFIALCIMRDAYFTQKRTMNSFLIFSFSMSIVALFNIISTVSSGEGFVSDSGLNLNVIPFCYGIMIFGSGIVAVIKKIINNKQAVEDE